MDQMLFHSDNAHDDVNQTFIRADYQGFIFELLTIRYHRKPKTKIDQELLEPLETHKHDFVSHFLKYLLNWN